MSKHTQGRLKMRQGFDDETKELYVPDSSIKKPFEPTALATVSADDAEGRANARRLVACWNACIDIRTEALADEAPRKLREDRDQLQAQCNELLEACKSLLTLTQIMANDEYEDIALVEFEVFSEITKSTRRLALADELAKARAAIAKATGAASSAAQPVKENT